MKNIKRFLVTSLGAWGVVLTLLAIPAHGQGLGKERGPYLNFGVGPNWMSAEFHADTGFRFSAAAGYNFNKWVGLELETGYLYNNTLSGFSAFGNQVTTPGVGVGQVPVLVNFVLRYENPSRVVPYVGFGLGGELVYSGSDSLFELVYQPMFGARYEINEKLSVGLGYKYLGSGLAAMFATMEGNHSVLIELNWKF
jgi:opacity protein-like surface antigen